MADEPSVFHDTPVRVLFGCLLGLVALESALVARALRDPVPAPPRVRATPSPQPTPPTGFRTVTLGDSRAHGWFVEDDGNTRRFHLKSGGTLEQSYQNLPPDDAAAAEDDRLAHWGPEYQRLRLETGGGMAVLEYSLNLPGERTTRTRVLYGRLRRRSVSLAITAPEERFTESLQELAVLGLPLEGDRP